MTEKRVLIPENMGSTFDAGNIEPNKYNVLFPSMYIVGTQTSKGTVGATGVEMQMEAIDVLNAPVAWAIESSGGEISNAAIDAATGLLTYDHNDPTGPTGVGYVVVSATDANGYKVNKQFELGVQDVLPLAVATSWVMPGLDNTCQTFRIDSITGGVEPYTISYDGGTTTTTDMYINNPDAGTVNMVVTDSEGEEVTLNETEVVDTSSTHPNKIWDGSGLSLSAVDLTDAESAASPDIQIGSEGSSNAATIDPSGKFTITTDERISATECLENPSFMYLNAGADTPIEVHQCSTGVKWSISAYRRTVFGSAPSTNGLVLTMHFYSGGTEVRSQEVASITGAYTDGSSHSGTSTLQEGETGVTLSIKMTASALNHVGVNMKQTYLEEVA